MYKILIIEDDYNIAKSLKNNLKKWNYDVEYVEKFDDILNQFMQYNPNLVLLDINLPTYNGYYWCEQIRKVSKVPIVFISSANDKMNIVMAINSGGDDFIEKPFDINVLIAKIQAILRRTYEFSNNDTVSIKDLVIDFSRGIISKNNQQVELTKNEIAILRILYNNYNKVVDRVEIINYLWQNDNFVDDNTLTVNINRLRKKLATFSCEDLIKTKKGIGYILCEN